MFALVAALDLMLQTNSDNPGIFRFV